MSYSRTSYSKKDETESTAHICKKCNHETDGSLSHNRGKPTHKLAHSSMPWAMHSPDMFAVRLDANAQLAAAMATKPTASSLLRTCGQQRQHRHNMSTQHATTCAAAAGAAAVAAVLMTGKVLLSSGYGLWCITTAADWFALPAVKYGSGYPSLTHAQHEDVAEPA